MAKRFTDTNKYKKPFLRGLQGAYKLLWDFLYHDCDHAGIWIVDFEITQSYLGKDMPVNKEEALRLFNADEVRIIPIDNGKKWFIPSFIEFQYGKLTEKNRAHVNVITILLKYGLIDQSLQLKNRNEPASPLQGAKEKEQEKELEKEKEQEQLKDKLEIFEKLFSDERFVENLSITHRGKDIKQAFEECYIHHSNAKSPPTDLSGWRQKLNTWLANTKLQRNGTGIKNNGKQQHTDSLKDTIRNTYGNTGTG